MNEKTKESSEALVPSFHDGDEVLGGLDSTGKLEFKISSRDGDGDPLQQQQDGIEDVQRQKQQQQQERLDLQTGRLVTRCQNITRLSTFKEAGERCDRWRRKSARGLRQRGRSVDSNPSCTSQEEKEDEEEKSVEKSVVDEEERRRQNVYRIRSHIKARTKDNRESFVDEENSMATVSSLSEYVRWTFRASFWEVGVATYVEFLVLIIIFTLVIWAVAAHQPKCFYGGGVYTASAVGFVDAFHLSWTTLSTVGYGIVAPQVNPDDAGGDRCIGLNMLMAIESYIGVLFASITGAILVGKVARVQSVALVRFSDPICVRYGTGVMSCQTCEDEAAASDDDDWEPPKDLDENALQKIPCPILEFRVVNQLSDRSGGEILNASVNVVATTLAEIDEAEADDEKLHALSSRSNRSQLQRTSMTATLLDPLVQASKQGASAVTSVAMNTGAKLLGAGKTATHATGSMLQRINYKLSHSISPGSFMSSIVEDDIDEAGDFAPYNSARDLKREVEREVAQILLKELSNKNLVDAVSANLKQERRGSAVAVDEGNSALSPRRLFHKLEIETDSHPFFRRVWIIRHRLDENSPLLTLKARRRIAQNSGFWPTEMNDHESVRKHLRFSELIVSFAGTANVSSTSVYTQKVYDYVDVNVGYSFAHMLHMSPTTHKIMVDHRLLNDVQEQPGGGAEPLRQVIGRQTEILADLAVEAQVMTQHMATQVTKQAQHMAEAGVEVANHAKETTVDMARNAKAMTEETFRGLSKRSLSGKIVDGNVVVDEHFGVDVEACHETDPND